MCLIIRSRSWGKFRAIPEAIVGKDPRVHLSGEGKYEIVRVRASGSLVHETVG
jgi:hypothetical protein